MAWATVGGYGNRTTMYHQYQLLGQAWRICNWVGVMPSQELMCRHRPIIRLATVAWAAMAQTGVCTNRLNHHLLLGQTQMYQ